MVKKIVLSIENLSVHLKKNNIFLVKNSSFILKEGECLGILGESGSGKSLTCKAMMGLLDEKIFSVTGKAIFNGENLLEFSKEKLRRLRGKDIVMILQNPMTCFDPLYTIGYQIAETLEEHTDFTTEEIREKSIKLLEKMQLKNPEEILLKFPHQLSGGMLQRIMIGIALILNPKLIIADEPTTAIDAITQYEIMKEFLKIKNENKVSMIFISHDLGVISKISDYIIVMNKGDIVARGTKSEIFTQKTDEFTEMLIEKKMIVMDKYREILRGK